MRAQRRSKGTSGAQNPAPCIVNIFYHFIAVGVNGELTMLWAFTIFQYSGIEKESSPERSCFCALVKAIPFFIQYDELYSVALDTVTKNNH